MPIINEYPSATAGQAFAPEMDCPEGRMPLPDSVPAVVNMGGNAVTGYAIRYTSIGELTAQSETRNEMEGADLLLRQRFGVVPNCSQMTSRMHP